MSTEGVWLQVCVYPKFFSMFDNENEMAIPIEVSIFVSPLGS
jgi:hypothetical protein